jgi:hypothetical protein
MGEESEVWWMVDPKSYRLRSVKQILRIMDSLFEMNGEYEIWVDDYQWCIYLPVDDPNQVLLSFNHEIENSHAAEIALRFYTVAGLLGLEVYLCSDIYSDSTNSAVGFIADKKIN